jgi:DNA-binding transcriptional MerR regulator
MRISDLSRQSGVSIPTIKFYLREGLLAPGTPTARNQAEYDDQHLTRLRMIRIMTTVGQLSLSAVREILVAVEEKGLSREGLCRLLSRALAEEPTVMPPEPVERAAAQERVDEYLDHLGWRVDPAGPDRATLGRVLAALQALGWAGDIDAFAPYFRVAEELATQELTATPGDVVNDETAIQFVAQALLHEVALVAIRRMAREHRATLTP